MLENCHGYSLEKIKLYRINRSKKSLAWPIRLFRYPQAPNFILSYLIKKTSVTNKTEIFFWLFYITPSLLRNTICKIPP